MKPFKQYVQESKHDIDYGMPGYDGSKEEDQANEYLIDKMIQTDDDYINAHPRRDYLRSIVYNHPVLDALKNHYHAIEHADNPKYAHHIQNIEHYEKIVDAFAPHLRPYMVKRKK